MQFVAHEARLSARDSDGVLYRATLEASAAKGNPIAREALAPLPYPEMLAYLHGWAMELVGTSGDGFNGLTPLSWPAMHAWAQETGRRPSIVEFQALRRLDAAIRHPENVRTDEPTPEGGPMRPAVIPAWPTQSAEAG